MSYKHWNERVTLSICFGYDSSEPSGRGQKDVLVIRMCVLSLVNCFSGFTEYLVFVQNSDRGLFEADYFATNIYNALQCILVFLTGVPRRRDDRRHDGGV